MTYRRVLAKALLACGILVHTQSKATSVVRDGDCWHIKTRDGTVRVDRVVLATNACTDGLWSGLERTVVPICRYQMARPPLDPELRLTIVPGHQAVSDTHGDLHFFRWSDAGRLVTGAGMAWHRPDMARVQRHVAARFARCCPQSASAAVLAVCES
jgi:sarcosine oxidase